MLDEQRNELGEEARAVKSEDFQDSMKIAWRYQNLPKMEVIGISWLFPLAVKMNLQSKCFSVGSTQQNCQQTVLQDCLLRANYHTPQIPKYFLITRDTERKGI